MLHPYATLLSFLITEKMNRAASRQMPIKVAQTIQSGMSHMWPGMLTSLLPRAVATNHPPIIMPLYFGGATFVTNEMPMGDSSNSAKVRMR